MKYYLFLVILLVPIVSADIMLYYDGEEDYSYDETGIYIGDYRYSFYDFDGTLSLNITNTNLIISSSEETDVHFIISKGRTSYNLVSSGEIYEGMITANTTPKTYSIVINPNVTAKDIKNTPWYMKNLVAFEYGETTLVDGTIDSKVFSIPIIYFAIFLLAVTLLWYFLIK